MNNATTNGTDVAVTEATAAGAAVKATTADPYGVSYSEATEAFAAFCTARGVWDATRWMPEIDEAAAHAAVLEAAFYAAAYA